MKEILGRRSIKKKLMALILSVSLLTVFLVCLAFIVFDRMMFKKSMVKNLEIQAKITAHHSTAALVFGDEPNAQSTLRALRADKQIVAACIYRLGDEVWATYFRDKSNPVVFPAQVDKAGPHFQKDALVIYEPMFLENERVGTLFLQSDLSELQSRLYRYGRILTVILLFSLLLTFFMASRLQRIISSPILYLSKVAREISENRDYSVRAHKPSEDEVGILTGSFNEMLDQIQERDTILQRTHQELSIRAKALQVELNERERAEAELQKAKEAAEAASRAKSEFLANMSHELRTPLNHIIGFTELVADGNYGPLNETQEEFLNDVLYSSRHLLELINDILDLSKIEAGKMELEWSEWNLRNLLEQSLIMVREKAVKHRIRLETDFQNVPQTIRADERKIKQVLYNLLSNAMKFTPDGGKVVLEVRGLGDGDDPEFGGAEDGRDVEIAVRDTGIGLKPEDLERIFTPFEQVESSASKKFAGTGLGLSLTKRIIELHGGKVWAESPGIGQGSGFHFILPLAGPPVDRGN